MILKKILVTITSLTGVAALLSLTGCAAQLGSTTLAQRVTQLENRVDQLKLQRQRLGEINEGINFAVDSDQLTPTSQKMIDQFLAKIPDYQVARYYVAGYTDNIGGEKLNYQLGQRRAHSVARYLITDKTIDPSHVITGSHGEGDPYMTNNNHQLNRHVDIIAYQEAIR